jgi:hypothetical protein
MGDVTVTSEGAGMDSTQQGRSRARSVARCAGLVAVTLVVVVPIAQLLVWSWALHPLVVVPAYVLGIPLWLTAVAQAWAVTRRVQELVGRRRSAQPAAQLVAEPAATLLVPAPRQEGAVPLSLRTPTP